ncbi:MAG: hypothetical protein HXS41_12940 [Theionarchaea archaeon]|nr:hypothetical protein [Theionarchaea archaeon]MBU7021958.1 hypothetical protein [Theionarchaea archaeon]
MLLVKAWRTNALVVGLCPFLGGLASAVLATWMESVSVSDPTGISFFWLSACSV